MIFCYSATQKTKPYAEMLSKILNRPVYMLESDMDTTRISSMVRVLWYVLTKKSAVVFNMPSDINDEEVYICGPVWGGFPAAPIRYFLEHAPLRDKKVHMLLTAGISHSKYITKAKDLIISAGYTPGKVEIFASNGEAIEEQVRELMT